MGDLYMARHDLGDELALMLASAGFVDAAEIGRGGFGVVYRCAQPTLDRTVAVKVLNSDLDDEKHRPLPARTACHGPAVRTSEHRDDHAGRRDHRRQAVPGDAVLREGLAGG